MAQRSAPLTLGSAARNRNVFTRTSPNCPSTPMKLTLQTSVLLASIFLSSCVIAVGEGQAEEHEEYAPAMGGMATVADEAQGEVQVTDASARPKPKKPVDTESLHIDLQLTQMDLQATENSVARANESAQHAVGLAERDLQLAREELDHFVNVEMELSRAESELSLDRTRGRLDDSRAELQQLLDMYKDEEFAESTKELVITRGKRGIEQSERSLELAEMRAADKREFEQARKMQSIKHKVEEAARSVRLKIEALETTQAEGEAKLIRLHNKLRLAHKKVDETVEDAN